MRKFGKILLWGVLAVPGWGQSLSVTGDCLAPGPGRLHLFLTDAGQFAVPQSGIRELQFDLDPRLREAQRVAFAFVVPPGEYALRAYVDRNGNGILDKGLFGPSEPWALSWKGPRPLGFPAFADVSFPVRADLRLPALVLEGGR